LIRKINLFLQQITKIETEIYRGRLSGVQISFPGHEDYNPSFIKPFGGYYPDIYYKCVERDVNTLSKIYSFNLIQSNGK